jgi:P-type conjugative transfer protein TrbJ
MKRIFLCLMAAGFSLLSFQAKAQWIVADPTNLVQNIISAVQGTTTATNMISNVQESIKIYKQGKEYYDGAPV